MTRRARRWAVVAAAGRGERYGGRLPKQYEKLLGRPVLSWSLGALLASPVIDGVCVALAPGDRRFARLPEARDPRVRTCDGGERREGSVANALAALEPLAEHDDWPCCARAASWASGSTS